MTYSAWLITLINQMTGKSGMKRKGIYQGISD